MSEVFLVDCRPFGNIRGQECRSSGYRGRSIQRRHRRRAVGAARLGAKDLAAVPSTQATQTGPPSSVELALELGDDIAEQVWKRDDENEHALEGSAAHRGQLNDHLGNGETLGQRGPRGPPRQAAANGSFVDEGAPHGLQADDAEKLRSLEPRLNKWLRERWAKARGLRQASVGWIDPPTDAAVVYDVSPSLPAGKTMPGPGKAHRKYVYFMIGQIENPESLPRTMQVGDNRLKQRNGLVTRWNASDVVERSAKYSTQANKIYLAESCASPGEPITQGRVRCRTLGKDHREACVELRRTAGQMSDTERKELDTICPP